MKEEQVYWREIVSESGAALPVDKSGENRWEQARIIVVEMGEQDTTALLQEVPKAYGTQIQEVLLTALGEALQKWTGTRQGWVVDVEGHGREDLNGQVDVSRTVGWFTAIYPIVTGTGGPTLMDRLQAMKRSWRNLPSGGIGYGVLRYLSKDPQLQQGAAEVLFNYLGRLDTVLREAGDWQQARESSGMSQTNSGPRQQYLLDITAQISQGRLRASWRYSADIHHEATIQKVAEAFIDSLKLIINQTSSSHALMRVDVSLSDVSQDDISQILERVDVDL